MGPGALPPLVGFLSLLGLLRLRTPLPGGTRGGAGRTGPRAGAAGDSGPGRPPPPWACGAAASAMPLLVEGRRVRLPQSAGDLVRAHPPLEERARLLRGQSVQQVGPQGLLYVQQRELAVTSPKDGSVCILGSDDATTCHIVVLRHTGNGATCLTHCDGTDTKAEVSLIMSSIKSFSDHTQRGRLEVHLVGGFSDDRQLSQKLTHQLLSEFDRQEDDIHLVTLCVTAVNVKTAEIYRASFPDRGPEEELRAARVLTGGPMISIYDAKTEQLRIGPYSWMPFPHVDFWLQQDDKQILEVRIYRLGKSYISGPCFPLCKEKKGFRLATSGFAFGSGTYFQDATGRSCRRGRGTLGGAACSVCVPVNATHASLLLMV
uniref:N-terminal asparagine amidase n=1 Tax=Sus scrofa TaxID=9823 RepID=A0A8D1ZAU2_PIG